MHKKRPKTYLSLFEVYREMITWPISLPVPAWGKGDRVSGARVLS